MPERDVANLPHGTTPRSFQVLAEWLRENRRALETQITGLAIRFEEIDRENKRRLDEIHGQTLKTNGRTSDNEERLTALEQSRQLATALADGHEQWESEREVAEREGRDSRERSREKLKDRLTSVGLVLLGLVGGGLLNHLGI